MADHPSKAPQLKVRPKVDNKGKQNATTIYFSSTFHKFHLKEIQSIDLGQYKSLAGIRHSWCHKCAGRYMC